MGEPLDDDAVRPAGPWPLPQFAAGELRLPGFDMTGDPPLPTGNGCFDMETLRSLTPGASDFKPLMDQYEETIVLLDLIESGGSPPTPPDPPDSPG